MTNTAINTKTVTGRRDVQYNCFDCLRADVDRIQEGHDAGTLKTLGNWNAGQVLWHCSSLMVCAMDGFPSGPPAPVRWLFTLLFKKKATSSGGAPPAGFKIPAKVDYLIPKDDMTFEDGMKCMRDVLGRLEAGEKFDQDSPIFGKLTHEQWVNLQLGHCRLHMSFLLPEG